MSQKILTMIQWQDIKSKITLKHNKPLYLRMCILDLSKVLIYEFHYDSITNKCNKISRIQFTDTGSLIYEMKAENVQ